MELKTTTRLHAKLCFARPYASSPPGPPTCGFLRCQCLLGFGGCAGSSSRRVEFRRFSLSVRQACFRSEIVRLQEQKPLPCDSKLVDPQRSGPVNGTGFRFEFITGNRVNATNRIRLRRICSLARDQWMISRMPLETPGLLLEASCLDNSGGT